MQNKKKLLIFDFDGTLFDSIRYLSEAEVNAVNEMGWKPITLDFARKTIGLSLSVIYEQVSGDKSLSKLQEFTDRFNKYFFARAKEAGYFDGIEEMLASLKEKGFILTIATGKGRASLDRLDKMLGFDKYFDFNICPSESEPKPSPEMVNKLLKKYGLKPEDAVVIGDSEHDLKMAQNAGVDTVAVSYGAMSRKELEQYHPTKIVDTVRELQLTLEALK